MQKWGGNVTWFSARPPLPPRCLTWCFAWSPPPPKGHVVCVRPLRRMFCFTVMWMNFRISGLRHGRHAIGEGMTTSYCGCYSELLRLFFLELAEMRKAWERQLFHSLLQQASIFDEEIFDRGRMLIKTSSNRMKKRFRGRLMPANKSLAWSGQCLCAGRQAGKQVGLPRQHRAPQLTIPQVRRTKGGNFLFFIIYRKSAMAYHDSRSFLCVVLIHNL